MGTSETNEKDPSLTARQKLAERDQLYVELLEQYKNNKEITDRTQRRLKTIFFCVVCIIFVLVAVAGSFAIINISQKTPVSGADIAVAITGFSSILSVVIILPSKIAEHLFPAGGEKDNREIMKMMLDYDLRKNTDVYEEERRVLGVKAPQNNNKGSSP